MDIIKKNLLGNNLKILVTLVVGKSIDLRGVPCFSFNKSGSEDK